MGPRDTIANGNSHARRRVLFVLENLTMAQVVRLVSLAHRMDCTRYEVNFACADFEPMLFENTKFRCWPINTIARADAPRLIERGERVYEEAAVRRYAEDELRLFDAVHPDLVVGDFRLSLSISAPHARIPFAALINAYWSPHVVRGEFLVPDHPIELLSLRGIALGAGVYSIRLSPGLRGYH